jgi:hypothetical protein
VDFRQLASGMVPMPVLHGRKCGYGPQKQDVSEISDRVRPERKKGIYNKKLQTRHHQRQNQYDRQSAKRTRVPELLALKQQKPEFLPDAPLLRIHFIHFAIQLYGRFHFIFISKRRSLKA